MGVQQHTIEEVTELTELTGQEGGRRQVTTLHSEHRFDLDVEPVQRAPRQEARTFHDDSRPRPLRSIEQCRVGEPGYSTIYSNDSLTGLERHRSTHIVRITPLRLQATHDAS